MPVISIITQHIGLAEEIKGDKNRNETAKETPIDDPTSVK